MKNTIFNINNVRLIGNNRSLAPYGTVRVDRTVPSHVKMKGYHIAISIDITEENL